MAANAAAVWECRASGVGVSDNNGGAYAPIRVSTFSGTDLVVDASLNTKVSSVTHNFVAADVGTRLQISAGTGWTPGFYTILSVAANAATLDSSPAATSTTGGTWTEVGIDYANQLAPQVKVGGGVVTSSVTTNVITFTGGTYTPTNADVGNHVQVISGTNTTPGTILHITATTSTTWTMDANVVSSGTATNVVANMGGALLTLGQLAAKMVASNAAWCTGAFSGGGLTFAQTATVSNTVPYTRIVGYGSVRGDATHATFTLTGGAGQNAVLLSGGGFSLEQLDIDCASIATSTAVNFGTSQSTHRLRRCKIANFTTSGTNFTTGHNRGTIEECEFTGGGAAATVIKLSTLSHVTRCFIHDNQGTAVTFASVDNVIIGCLIANNSGASSDGISTSAGTAILGNTIHNNGRHGINCISASATLNPTWRDNLLTNNGGFGIVGTVTTALPAAATYDGNAFFSNTSGTRSLMDSTTGILGVNPYLNVNDVLLTGSPYVGPTTGTTANFALNNTTGAGAACRAAGSPGTWPGNTGTTSYPDMGAVQTRGSSTSPAAGGPPALIVAA